MNAISLLLSIVTLGLISSCSGTYQAYYQTIDLIFSEQVDFQKSLVDVEQSEIDIVSVKRGDRAAIVMALAFLENGQHKWVSNDNAMLILQNGRIIRTIGLGDDLLHLSNLLEDPLRLLPEKNILASQNNPWTRISDRTGDQYGYPQESTFSTGKNESINALDLNTDTTLYIESVDYRAISNFIRIDKSWKNYFWYAKNGDLLKSIQKISPISESIEITYLSRIARFNN